MTASRTPVEPGALISPVIDCEPPPVGVTACRPPTPKALRRRTPRRSRQAPVPPPAPVQRPPQTAVAFADAALRRVLEVIDRRRPVAQLRSLLAPALTDTVLALTRDAHEAAATLRTVRLRMVDDAPTGAAEVFGTYTRGPRVRAIAARIALDGDRWRIVALQIG
ncbi:Rv3235 family protein [Mycobacterium sp. B14F4]|uniref:Rv3235 family protein n=1 Tax=Mycobacterium sp. B14F4 TaxID=3153565 RepID=UPI00325F7B8D